MKKFSSMIAVIAVSSVAVVAQASPITQDNHEKPYWQILGTDAGTNNSGTVSDYGVFWSIDGGAFGQETTLYVGQTVQFQFNMYKPSTGTHYADLLEAWVDWNQDGFLEDGTESIIYAEEIVRPTKGAAAIAKKGDEFQYLSDTFTLTNDMVGDLWLKALVTCTHSVTVDEGYRNNWNGQWWDINKGAYEGLLNPYGSYYQGETENYHLTVVSEPAAAALFGLGLVALVARKRRKQA